MKDRRLNAYARHGPAANPALPAPLFDALLAVGDGEIHEILAERDDLTDDRIRALLARGDGDTVHTLITAGRAPWPQIPRDDPNALASAVRAGVAPPEAARRLAAHPDDDVRARTASSGVRRRR